MSSGDLLPVLPPPGILALGTLHISPPEPDGKLIVAIQGPLGEPEGKAIVVTNKGCPASDWMLIVVVPGPCSVTEEKHNVVINGGKSPVPKLGGVVQETPPASGGVAPSLPSRC